MSEAAERVDSHTTCTYTGSVRLEWAEGKNEANARKHGFDFRDAHEIFDSPMWVREDTRVDYGEARWIGVGTIRGRVAVVVYTERGDDDETIRIISLRKAFRHEEERYREIVFGLGPHRRDDR
jgi:uncharacterized protein